MISEFWPFGLMNLRTYEPSDLWAVTYVTGYRVLGVLSTFKDIALCDLVGQNVSAV